MLRRTVSREALAIAASGIALGSRMIAIVILATLIASWRPSRQVGRVDPMQLLREE